MIAGRADGRRSLTNARAQFHTRAALLRCCLRYCYIEGRRGREREGGRGLSQSFAFWSEIAMHAEARVAIRVSQNTPLIARSIT